MSVNKIQQNISRSQNDCLYLIDVTKWLLGFDGCVWTHPSLGICDKNWELVNWSKGHDTGKEYSQVKNKDFWRWTQKMQIWNLGLKLKCCPRTVGTALMRKNVTSPVICKRMGLLYSTHQNWTGGSSWAKWGAGWKTCNNSFVVARFGMNAEFSGSSEAQSNKRHHHLHQFQKNRAKVSWGQGLILPTVQLWVCWGRQLAGHSSVLFLLL